MFDTHPLGTGKMRKDWTQARIVHPYIKRVVEYNPEVDGDLMKFFFNQIESAMNMRAEREEKPDAAGLLPNYDMRSDIAIASFLFKILVTHLGSTFLFLRTGTSFARMG